jgi:membrane associated rhomboid family serine protease
VIPLKDTNPTATRPVVTLLLIAACVVVYFFVEPIGQVSFTGHSTNASVQQASTEFSYHYAAVPCELTRGRPLTVTDVEAGCQRRRLGSPLFPGKDVWLAVLVSMFLHGSVLHIAGNMLFLWIFGNNVEDRLGHVAYLIFYLLAGAVATVVYVASDPTSTVPLLGASGAIAGVMGVYLVFFPRAPIRTLILIPPVILWPRLPAWILLAFWFVSQFFVSPGSAVAWPAHVGGFLFGVVVAWSWPRRRTARARRVASPSW